MHLCSLLHQGCRHASIRVSDSRNRSCLGDMYSQHTQSLVLVIHHCALFVLFNEQKANTAHSHWSVDHTSSTSQYSVLIFLSDLPDVLSSTLVSSQSEGSTAKDLDKEADVSRFEHFNVSGLTFTLPLRSGAAPRS